MANQNQAAFQDLRVIQQQLATDYIDFFKELRDRHSSESPVHQQAQNALNGTQEVIRLIGRMLGAGGTAPTVKELNQFQAEMDSLIQLRSDLIVSSAVERTKPQPIAPTNRIIQAAAQQYANRQQQHATAGRHSLSNATESWRRDALGVTKAVTEAMATPLLGPFARMGIEAGEWTASRLWRGTKAVVGGAFRGARGLYRRSADDREEHDNLHSFDADGARGMYDGTSIRQGLYQFFDEDAFKAKWTRQLLKSSGGDEESNSSGGGGLFSGLFSGGSIWKWLGLGAAGAVGTGMLDSVLENLFPDEWPKIRERVKEVARTGVEKAAPIASTAAELATRASVTVAAGAFEGLTKGFGDLWAEAFKIMEEEIPIWTKVFGEFSHEIVEFFSEGNPFKKTVKNAAEIIDAVDTVTPGWLPKWMAVVSPGAWAAEKIGREFWNWNFSKGRHAPLPKKEPKATELPEWINEPLSFEGNESAIEYQKRLQRDRELQEIQEERIHETKSQHEEETISLLTKISEGIAKIGTGSGIGIDARGPINAGASSELSFINRSSTPWNDSLYNVGSA